MRFMRALHNRSLEQAVNLEYRFNFIAMTDVSYLVVVLVGYSLECASLVLQTDPKIRIRLLIAALSFVAASCDLYFLPFSELWNDMLIPAEILKANSSGLCVMEWACCSCGSGGGRIRVLEWAAFCQLGDCGHVGEKGELGVGGSGEVLLEWEHYVRSALLHLSFVGRPTVAKND
ncbi:hypothetical protein Tco_0905560 [Tanacetum coccineum]